jgi:hypothetical protein
VDHSHAGGQTGPSSFACRQSSTCWVVPQGVVAPISGLRGSLPDRRMPHCPRLHSRQPRRAMSDADEISALVHSYARLLDAGDVDAVVAMFEHSTWRSLPNGSKRRGSAEIRPVYEHLMAQIVLMLPP